MRAVRALRAAAATAGVVAAGGAAIAGLLPATRPATAALALCNVSASVVAFGSYNPVSAAPTNTSGTISVSCIPAAQVLIQLSAGGSGSFAPRAMTGPTVLAYNLYVDAGHTTVWGDGTGGTSTVTGTFFIGTPPVVDYAQIFAQQNAPAGAYSDTIVATINF